VLTGYVPNQGDAWQFTLDQLAEFYSQSQGGHSPDVGRYLEAAALLGKRTAELHRALASDPDDPAFAPEPTSVMDQRSFYQGARGLCSQAFALLRSQLERLPEDVAARGKELVTREPEVLRILHTVLEHPVSAQRIRTHGDYHLGQVLFTGQDFVIIDFEGEPARSLSERRLKRWALRDVAGMLRSFDYASQAARRSRPEAATLEAPASRWVDAVSNAFLQSYTVTAAGAPFMPATPEESEWLLRCLLVEKALYELGYELNSRPDWVSIPVGGLNRLMQVLG
jgi:maltose alpha-D-glucosyltransferase/alpha-amylase